jgi:hypothetical protein
MAGHGRVYGTKSPREWHDFDFCARFCKQLKTLNLQHFAALQHRLAFS